jgi:hypothetical protein
VGHVEWEHGADQAATDSAMGIERTTELLGPLTHRAQPDPGGPTSACHHYHRASRDGWSLI